MKSFRNSISLREEIAQMLTDYGTWVLYQRNSSKVHCTCWSEINQEGNSKHTLCAGTGWVVHLERRKARKVTAAIPISEPSLMSQTELGHMAIQQFRWYLPHNTFPRSGDIIYEVNWDRLDEHNPVSLVSANVINSVAGNRGDGGRIEYFEAATRVTSLNLKVQNIIIRSIGRMKDYLIGG